MTLSERVRRRVTWLLDHVDQMLEGDPVEDVEPPQLAILDRVRPDELDELAELFASFVNTARDIDELPTTAHADWA